MAEMYSSQSTSGSAGPPAPTMDTMDLNIHFWCNGLNINGHEVEDLPKSDTITLYNIRTDALPSKERLLVFRWLALCTLMKMEWGHNHYRPKVKFKISQKWNVRVETAPNMSCWTSTIPGITISPKSQC